MIKRINARYTASPALFFKAQVVVPQTSFPHVVDHDVKLVLVLLVLAEACENKRETMKKQCKSINTCIKHATGLLPLVHAMQPAPLAIAPEVHLHGNRFKPRLLMGRRSKTRRITTCKPRRLLLMRVEDQKRSFSARMLPSPQLACQCRDRHLQIVLKQLMFLKHVWAKLRSKI